MVFYLDAGQVCEVLEPPQGGSAVVVRRVYEGDALVVEELEDLDPHVRLVGVRRDGPHEGRVQVLCNTRTISEIGLLASNINMAMGS